MLIYGTPRSHFTRKVRLILDHLGCDYEMIDIGNAADADPAAFGDSPLMSVPVLRDGDATVFDSDHIAAHIARTRDPDDQFEILTDDAATLNARAVLNGAMAAEVRLVLGERTGLKTAGAPYFEKARAVIANAATWLEARADLLNAERPRYLDFHFISFWDHARFYRLVDVDRTRLGEVAARLSANDLINRSAPV